ncbi:hypothetical protein H311_00151 [Anncaliia algerae PRA109]|nr:hypothetical protein H311_00151 [Anncaliia algerae PRA109]
MIKRYKINLPPSFTYDIKNISVLHNKNTNHVAIECESLPEEILESITNLYKHFTNINDYVSFITANLNKLLDGMSYEEIQHKNPIEFYDGPTNVKMLSSFHFLLLQLKGFTLFVKCIKCNKSIKCNSEHKFICKCANHIEISYKSKIINSPMVGNLCINNAFFISFVDLFFIGSCYCNKEIEFTNSIDKLCTCGDKLYLSIDSIDYLKKENKPIVTCTHYKESKRMFIFPCCNTPYTCPLCHDKNEAHKYQWAYQMICLVCNKRDNVKDICSCGYEHIKKKSAFWEGGKGKRDKTTMSKKDSKKYKK